MTFLLFLCCALAGSGVFASLFAWVRFWQPVVGGTAGVVLAIMPTLAIGVLFGASIGEYWAARSRRPAHLAARSFMLAGAVGWVIPAVVRHMSGSPWFSFQELILWGVEAATLTAAYGALAKERSDEYRGPRLVLWLAAFGLGGGVGLLATVLHLIPAWGFSAVMARGGIAVLLAGLMAEMGDGFRTPPLTILTEPVPGEPMRGLPWQALFLGIVAGGVGTAVWHGLGLALAPTVAIAMFLWAGTVTGVAVGFGVGSVLLFFSVRPRVLVSWAWLLAAVAVAGANLWLCDPIAPPGFHLSAAGGAGAGDYYSAVAVDLAVALMAPMAAFGLVLAALLVQSVRPSFCRPMRLVAVPASAGVVGGIVLVGVFLIPRDHTAMFSMQALSMIAWAMGIGKAISALTWKRPAVSIPAAGIAIWALWATGAISKRPPSSWSLGWPGAMKPGLADLEQVEMRSFDSAYRFCRRGDGVRIYCEEAKLVSSACSTEVRDAIERLPMFVDPRGRRKICILGTCEGSWRSGWRPPFPDKLQVVLSNFSLFEVGQIGSYHSPARQSGLSSSVTASDGAAFSLLHDPEKYDALLAILSPSRQMDEGAWYASEWFGLIGDALDPRGTALLMIPLAAVSEQDLHAQLRTFASVFPHVSLWYASDALVLAGRKQPWTFDPAGLQAILDAQPSGAGNAAPKEDPLEVLSLFIAADDGVRRLAGEGPILTRDRPLTEYFSADPSLRGAPARILKELFDAAEDVSPWVIFPEAPGARWTLEEWLAKWREGMQGVREGKRLSLEADLADLAGDTGRARQLREKTATAYEVAVRLQPACGLARRLLRESAPRVDRVKDVERLLASLPSNAYDAPSPIAALLDEAAGADPDRQQKALEQLALYRDERLVPYYERMLSHKDLNIRLHAVWGLEKYPGAKAALAEVRAIGDLEWPVRQAAARSLGNADLKSAFWPLIRALDDTEAPVREAALKSLERLTGALDLHYDVKAAEPLLAAGRARWRTWGGQHPECGPAPR